MPSSSFNAYGFEVDYILAAQRQPAKIVSSPAELAAQAEAQKVVFDALSRNQIATGVKACFSLFGESHLYRARQSDRRLADLIGQE